jgi:hypothetical protein
MACAHTGGRVLLEVFASVGSYIEGVMRDRRFKDQIAYNIKSSKGVYLIKLLTRTRTLHLGAQLDESLEPNT